MTKAFTFGVTMLVQVFAEDKSEAALLLDKNGGYVSERTVELRSVVDVESPKKLKAVKDGDKKDS
jgi:hypothetical protein